VARLTGDPGPARWLWFSIGFRLPAENREWVKHELTDAGWRMRTVLRHLAVIVPICAILVIVLTITLPAPLWLGLMMTALILAGSVFTVAAYADDIRASRLRQHGLDVPDDPDLGHPAH
jgi:archaellum biogenesis protein FlaJ (TadC family)